MNAPHGRKVWFFPDGDLPPRNPDPPFEPKESAPGHESLVVLNPGFEPAQIRLTVYFPDRDPIEVGGLSVGACRVFCFRLDAPIGNPAFQIPMGQYALKLESTQPVIAQHGRMDVRQANLAYYTTMGFPG